MRQKRNTPAVRWTESDVVELKRAIDTLVEYTEVANRAFGELNERVWALEHLAAGEPVGE